MRTHLIQRLLKPYKEDTIMTKLAESFSFGGGLVNGGLSNDAMKLLRSTFRFDYMGSAEFEFGAVPEALGQIWEYSKKGLLKKSNAVIGELELKKKVYYICRKEDEERVKRVITHLAEKGDYENTKLDISLKESTYFKNVLEDKEFCRDVIGWLELDNYFAFFIDKEIFERFTKLFNITMDNQKLRVKKDNSDSPNENYLETQNIKREDKKSGQMPIDVDNQPSSDKLNKRLMSLCGMNPYN